MATSKAVVRFLPWRLPASRVLCAASLPLGSGTVTESDAFSEYKPLYRRLSALSIGSRGSVAETMKEWYSEGRRVTVPELMGFVRGLRRYKNHTTALELIDWMETNGIKLSSGIHAVRLDLIAKTKGIDEAEKYFENLPGFIKSQKTYGALLGSYCRAKMSDKAIALHDLMQALHISCDTIAYNNLMSLHMKLGHPEKVPLLFQEMKAANISPDVVTQCLLMNSYSSMNEIDSVESFVSEIEKDAHGPLNWCIYSHMASHYITARLFEKAESALKKLEEVMDSRDRTCYHCLISMYAAVCNLAEVIRVWKFLKDSFIKTTNTSFLFMFQACIKLGELDMLKQCYDEWKNICLSFDIRLTYVVMTAYLRKDMIKEVEYVLDNVIERGLGNDYFWGKFIRYFLRKNEMDLALKSLQVIASLDKPHQWRPKKELVMEFFMYFEKQNDVEKARVFCEILKDIDSADVDVHKFLIRTNLATVK